MAHLCCLEVAMGTDVEKPNMQRADLREHKSHSKSFKNRCFLNLLGCFWRIIPQKDSLPKYSQGSSCQQQHCDLTSSVLPSLRQRSIPSKRPESSLAFSISPLLCCSCSMDQRMKWNICSAAMAPSFLPIIHIRSASTVSFWGRYFIFVHLKPSHWYISTVEAGSS